MRSFRFPRFRQHWLARQGFTLAEMVIVIGVLAILVGISTPALFQMMLRQDIQEEEIALQEIRKAIEAYVADRNILPANTADWSAELAGFTSLSQQEIANSIWGHPRTFRMFENNSQVQNVAVTITYVTVLSTGPDRTANAATNLPVSSGQFDTNVNNSGWWYKQADPIAAFGAVAPAGDDLIMTYTNYPEKMAQLQETLKRMNRIVGALDAFSKTRYSELVSRCADETRDANGDVTGTWATLCNGGMPERLIYIPRSQTANPMQTPVDADANYYATPGTTAPSAFTTDGTPTQRASQMQAIMRTLGLSDETCCSAVTGAPFYLYSNPRQKLAGNTCATSRPDSTQMKLPARLTTTPDACG
jgi:prepilin-type N-terminal cleavage/methylation domain-containing protein